MSKLLHVIFLIILSISLNVFTVFKSKAEVQNLLLTKLSVEDGLSQSTVNSIVQDDAGFIWIATANGINNYDGYTFRQLSGPNNNFNNFSVFNLMKDREGLIWMNPFGNGIYTYNPTNNEYKLIPTNIVENREYYITDFIEGAVDDIWISTSKSISLYNKKTNFYQQVLDLNQELGAKDHISQIKIHDGVLYIASKNGIFAYLINSNQWRKLPSLIHTNAALSDFNLVEATKTYTLHINQDNILYLGSNDGFFSINVQEIKQYIQHQAILPKYDLLIEHISLWQTISDGDELYLGTDRGLFSFNMLDNKGQFLFDFSDYFEHIVDNNISTLIKDKSGVLWLGSHISGVYRWDPKREIVKNFHYHKNSPSSLSFNHVSYILPDITKDNLLWVGTENGLNLVDVAKKTVKQFLVNRDTKSRYNQSKISKIFAMTPEKMLLSTYVGMRLFDVEQEKLIELPFDPKVNELLDITQHNVFLDENILWTVNDKGIFKISLDSGEIDTLPEISNRVSLDKVWSILGYLPETKLLLISCIDGLWGFNTDTREFTELYKHPGILESEYVRIDNWTIDNKGIFWLSFPTRGLVGLTLPDFEAKYFYHKSNSIIDNNVYSLMTDTEGDIWFSTHDGIFMLDSDSHLIRNFSIDDGLAVMEFNNSAYAKLNDQRFVYGSMEGISLFNPLELKNVVKSEPFKLRITNIDVLNRKLDLPMVFGEENELSLKYDDVGIRIDFSTFSFSNRKKTSYEYGLTGQSTVYYPPTFENYITFPSLSSGQHILEIRAKSPITGNYSEPTKLKIRVSYIPWLSPYAYFVYCFVLIVALTLLFIARKNRQVQMLAAHEDVKFRENRLQLALTGSNSEVWDWQVQDNLMFGKRISHELGYVDFASSYSFDEHVALIHPDDRQSFESNWLSFLNIADFDVNFSCTYRMISAHGEWLWYKDLGKIVSIDQSGKATRITGSYTNITQSRADEERAQYYGEAFKQTKDWVLIINDDFSRITANQSFRDVFNWTEEQFQFDLGFLSINKQRWKFYRLLLPTLAEGEHWSGEEHINTRGEAEFHVILNINIGKNVTDNSLYYVCVFTDITAQKMAEKELRYLASYDHLTDLPNRSLLLERIKDAMNYSDRKSTSIALFFIDLDKFKQVNDSLGHEYGDMLLVEITRRLSDVLRVDDTVARLGGDEFVVLLESFRGNAHLGRIAQKIISVIEQPVRLKGNIVSIGASIGIALYPDDAGSSQELLRHADVAMYQAKQLGRNKFQFFTPRMNFEISIRLKNESNLKLAHKNKEFINHYQPIIDNFTGKMIGVELLMRWQRGEGLMPPAEFIPIAEELGLIIPMTEDALERALVDLKVWHKFNPEMFMSVNLSAQYFLKEDLVDYVTSMLKKHELNSEVLKFEITESTLLFEPEKAISTMWELSKKGITLALDDFGTGFSSLSYLKRLPLDIIKIDGSFVSGIGINKADKSIVDATLVLAKRLGMDCIAEGVETKEQKDYLVEQNCQFFQGYLFSKPVDADVIKGYLSNNSLDITA